MKILVTGGAGFIGSNFVHYWNSNHPDDSIVVLDKLTYAGNLETLKDLEGQKNYKFVKGDIVDVPMVDQLFKEEKFDIVVHFAAETHVDRSITGPAVFVKTNVMGTQVLLDASLNHNVKRFHHVSTDEVFGAIEENETRKFNESTPYAPRSPYSASKAGSDHLVRAYNVTYGLLITITNCSNNYGPYMFPEKLIPLAITNLMEGKKIPVYGQGKQSRDWLYVEDHCRAIEAVLEKGKVGETYLVGGMDSDEWTNLQVVQEICKIMGKNPKDNIEFVPDRAGHDFKYVVDWSKIKNELGWKPQHEFKEWLKETVNWYKDNEDWWKPLKKV